MSDTISRRICTSMSFIAMFLLSEIATAGVSLDHNYTEWGDLLGEYVANGFVDYEGLKKSPENLDAVLESFQAATQEEYEKWSQNQKISFWLNVYNYSAIRLVVKHDPIKKRFGWKALAYPDKSIQQIPDIWNRKAIQVLSKERSLNEIEHEILRREFQEPRIHFALVCASLGCPVLRSEPFVQDKLDFQLNDQLKKFLADPKKFRYNDQTNTLYLSPIFKWFKKDFEHVGGIHSFLKAHLSETIGRKISEKTKIEWLDYDWSLNESLPAGRQGSDARE